MGDNAKSIDPESLVARIIAELQANPDAQTMLLRALLTNEFQGVPIRLERIEADVAQIKCDVEVLKTDVEALKTDVAGLKTDVAGLKTDVAGLKTDVNGLKTDVAVLKGDSLELKLHRSARSLLSQRLGLRRTRMLQSTLQETSTQLLDPVEKALKTGVINDAQESRIDATDIIVRALRKEDQAPVWVALEASNHIGQRDIERAHQSAAALGAVFGQPAIAAVAGYRIHPNDQERADRNGVQVLQVEVQWAA